MPVQMTPKQLSFWRELLAPFEDHQLSTTKRGGKELTYVDKRAITNRLDSVVGPHGWYPEYEATNRGYKCRLYIRVPMDNGDMEWMAKEDGAGFEEMGSYNKQTNEWEADVDNDEKSGYTNALRRAAQDAWGIARYLYRKGIPTFLDPNAVAGPAPAVSAPSPTPEPTPAPTPRATQASRQAAAQADNFRIPKAGMSVWGWCKEMEKAFETSLVNGMGEAGVKRDFGKVMKDWDQAQVDEVCMDTIGFLRTLPTYKGQFETLWENRPGYVEQSPKPSPGVPTREQAHADAEKSGARDPKTEGRKPTNDGVNVADLRKELMGKMQAHVERQIGRAATATELKGALGKISAQCKDEFGHEGEIADSLRSLADVVWLRNMIAFVDNQIAQSGAAGDQGDDEIPF